MLNLLGFFSTPLTKENIITNSRRFFLNVREHIASQCWEPVLKKKQFSVWKIVPVFWHFFLDQFQICKWVTKCRIFAHYFLQFIFRYKSLAKFVLDQSNSVSIRGSLYMTSRPLKKRGIIFCDDRKCKVEGVKRYQMFVTSFMNNSLCTYFAIADFLCVKEMN